MSIFCLRVLLKRGKYTRKYITNRSCNRVTKKNEEVFTDEYQDSNLIQEMILSAVSKKL